MKNIPSMKDIQDEHISSTTWVLGFAFAVTLIVFVQRLIFDLQNLLQSIIPQNILNAVSQNTGPAIAAIVVTIPLSILAILAYITQKDAPLKNPYKFASAASLLAMAVNILLMIMTILAFLNDVNSTITTYLITLILMGLLVFGMVKIQGYKKEEEPTKE